ncbi:hypothetical protein A4G31_10360 [Mycobacterium persicum]|nr:hypothetical protein A4G31_10360 [Mycobacterium persicum]
MNGNTTGAGRSGSDGPAACERVWAVGFPAIAPTPTTAMTKAAAAPPSCQGLRRCHAGAPCEGGRVAVSDRAGCSAVPLLSGVASGRRGSAGVASRGGQFPGGGVALVGILGQTPGDHLVETRPAVRA